jgi:hypothetical protein
VSRPSLIKPILPPKDAPKIVEKCSFFSTLRSADPVAEVQQRWQDGTLDTKDEVEYISYFLDYSAILVSMDQLKVLCGFRTQDILAKGRTIVLLLRSGGDPEVLGSMTRKKKGTGGETIYNVDVACEPFQASLAALVQAHQDVCTADAPTITTALSALNDLSISDFGGVLDPLGRLQGFLAPGTIYLPFVPTIAPRTTSTRFKDPRQLHEIREEEFPSYVAQTSAMKRLKAQTLFGYEPSKDRRNAAGQIVEVETVTGFRIPVRAMVAPTPGPVAEVFETVRAAKGFDASGNVITGEQVLVSGLEDPEGRTEKDKLDYRSELVEFLLFSLANDIAPASDDDARDATYAGLRRAIETKTESALRTELKAWYDREAYEDATDTTYKFISKVRKPCGQMKDEPTCSKSSLCGWDKGDCKVQVRTSRVTPAEILDQIRKTLLTNEKQRALVLDNRLSRFFSTVLYLEMPNETIRVGI